MNKSSADLTVVLTMAALVLLLGVVPWVTNAYKFASCDFEEDYKCEAIHAVGVFVPPAAIVTVWFDSDS